MSNTMAVVIAENVRLHRQNEALRLSLKRVLEQQQDHIDLAKRFYEGWHDGIKIDTGDIMLLLDAAEVVREAGRQQGPLTDEQIKDVAASCMWRVREQDILDDAVELARAIEAAHGITKGGE